eukprot:TRINITY_DN106123_c0_g1_i1.p2 TRINITY_DN106123_c0_g1~~TRINITY_DN106123_c0_g1_i1.p2  ORF type:complete len:114 (+),score=17.07 TRINITY_DN106123_c0_g1_i1:54-395(+)
MAMRSRSALAAAFVLAVLALVATHAAFVTPTASQAAQSGVERPRGEATALPEGPQPTVVLGAGAGFLAAAPQPAHALLLQDEILPISFAVIGATLWGIVLGFVLLRLQEAFPE